MDTTKINDNKDSVTKNHRRDLYKEEDNIDVENLTPFLHQSNVSVSPFWRQVIAVTPICIACMQGSMTMGHSATLLPQLQIYDKGIPADDYTGSWIASAIGVSMVPLPLVAGVILEKYGRKPAMAISGILIPIGWTWVALAPNLTHMLIGRLFLGAAYGIIGPVLGTYIGEVTDPKYRGFILVMTYVSMGLGVLMVHACDVFLYWRWTACICGIISLSQIATTMFVPESPVWYISKNRLKEAANAFTWLRGYDDQAMTELKELIIKQKAKSNRSLNLKQKLNLLFTPQFIKPLILVLILFSMSQCSGLNHLVFYSVDIVRRSIKDVNNNIVILSIDSVRVVTSVISCVANKTFARRPVFFTSCIGSAVSMLGLMIYLYFSGNGSINAPWFPITCYISFILFLSLGILPMPGLACSELFPIYLREIGNALVVCWCYSMIFLVAKLTPSMFINFGDLITFGTCLLLLVVGGIVIYLFLPETKGKTLQEIQDNFKSW